MQLYKIRFFVWHHRKKREKKWNGSTFPTTENSKKFEGNGEIFELFNIDRYHTKNGGRWNFVSTNEDTTEQSDPECSGLVIAIVGYRTIFWLYENIGRGGDKVPDLLFCLPVSPPKIFCEVHAVKGQTWRWRFSCVLRRWL